jgi:hypothetical protein
MNNMGKNILRKLTTGAVVLCLGISICACGSSQEGQQKETSTTETVDLSSEESVETSVGKELGTLGEDFSIDDIDEQVGNSFTFTGIFWSTRKDSYGYQFSYKVHQDSGATASYAFWVKDETEGSVLSALDDVSYKDEVAVQMTAIFDKTVIFTVNESGSSQVIYCVTVKEAEILDRDSEEAREASGDYYTIGDTIALSNGVVYTITEGGLYTEYSGTDFERRYAFIELDIDNQSEEDITVNASDALFYGDDYVLDTGFPSEQDNTNFMGMTISAGRKGNGRFYSECSDYNSISRIEVELGDVIIVVKDGLEDTAFRSDEDSAEGEIIPISMTDGQYEFDNGSSAVSTAEVGFSPEFGNYIFIDCWGYGDHELVYFEGSLEENDDGTYYAYCEDFEASITVTFVTGGLYVTLYSSDNDEMYLIDGYYTMQ